MLDIALDSNHDLDVSSLDLRLIDTADRVRQQLTIKLRLWVGEWFLDTEFGTPYLQSILGKQLTLSGAITALKKSILEVEGVQRIDAFSYTFNRETRTLDVAFEAVTPYGLVEYVTAKAVDRTVEIQVEDIFNTLINETIPSRGY